MEVKSMAKFVFTAKRRAAAKRNIKKAQKKNLKRGKFKTRKG